MDSQKKRTTNFSSDEKHILTELVLKYRDTIENKRTDATTNSMKLKGWIRLAQEFNTISMHCHRTHTVLKCCWENIKRQTKKDRAARKKNIFMTGGGKPPPSPSNQGSSSGAVEAILGPALEGIPNVYDSDGGDVFINEIIEVQYPLEKPLTLSLEDITECDKVNKENKDPVNDRINFTEINQNDIEETVGSASKNQTENHILQSVLNENKQDVDDPWNVWTPKNLKTPVSEQLRIPKSNEEDWLKRRRPNQNCMADTLVKEKINLVKILQANAEKESSIRLAILEEQLKQEKLKTKKLMN